MVPTLRSSGGSLLLKRTVGAVWEAFLPSLGEDRQARAGEIKSILSYLNSLMKTSLRMISEASLKIVEKMTVTLSDLASTYIVSSSLGQRSQTLALTLHHNDNIFEQE